MNNTQCYAANESENWKGKGFILTAIHIDVSCEQETIGMKSLRNSFH